MRAARSPRPRDDARNPRDKAAAAAGERAAAAASRGLGAGSVAEMQGIIPQASAAECEACLRSAKGDVTRAVQEYFARQDRKAPTAFAVQLDWSKAPRPVPSKAFGTDATVWDVFCFAYEKVNATHLRLRIGDKELGEKDYGTPLAQAGFSATTSVYVLTS